MKYALDLDLRWRCNTGNIYSGNVVVRAAWIIYKVDEYHSAWDTGFVYGISWRVSVACVCVEIHDLRLIRRAHDLRNDDGGVVDWPNCPVAETRLIRWRCCRNVKM